MYSIVLLVASLGAALSFPTQNYQNVPRCAQPMSGGLCLAYFPSFYFNPSTEKCESFIYGGCQGNENRFSTERECLEACGGFKIEKHDFELRTESEESTSKSSESDSSEESQPSVPLESDAAREPEPLEESLLVAPLESSDASAESQPSVPLKSDAASQPELSGESLPLAPLESDASGESLPQTDVQPANPAEQEADPCTLPSNSGPCMAYFPRFYFNGDDCVDFIYGGCQANENNFKTREDCLRKCKTDASEEASSSSEDVSPSSSVDESSSGSDKEATPAAGVESSSTSVSSGEESSETSS